MSELDRYLGDSKAVIGATIRAYRRTYAINVRRFDPKAGDDAHTFGAQNWRGGLFYLEQEFGNLPGVIVDRPNNHLRIRLPNGVTLRPYRAHFEGENLAFFPTSETRAQLARENAASYSFFEYSAAFGGDGLPVSSLVIQHDGDHLEGLRAIYLGAPIDGDDPANGWFFSECIYVRDTSEADNIDIELEDGTGTVPFTQQPAPNVEVIAEERPDRDLKASTDPEESE